MWLLPTTVFWSSLGLVAYTYAGYPATIWALSRLRRRPAPSPSLPLPSITVLMVSRNEQARIADKLDNILSLDYPADRRQVIVVSDASDDDTDRIVEGYAERDVRLVRVDRPSGKAACINHGMEHARGELVVFCDTRQTIENNALLQLVAPFSEPKVGAVSGELMLRSQRGAGLYWAYEKAIRQAESRFDSLVGVSGAFYAIRRHLFRPLPDECLLDDVFTPMQIVCEGFRVVLESGARFFDDEAPLDGEFARKARTLAGNFQLLHLLPEILNPRRNRLLFQFASHKLARLACPAALAGLLASNVVLVATFAPGWPLYVGTLAAQLAGYGLALNGALRKEKAGRLSRLSHTFVVLNAAAVAGLRRYLGGDFSWTTHRAG